MGKKVKNVRNIGIVGIYLFLFLLILLLSLTAWCSDRPLTPGHRSLEGDIWVLKLDANGDTQWFTVIDSGKYDEAFSIIQTSDNGYAVAGSISDLNTFSPVPRAVRLNDQGIILWDLTYQTAKGNRGTDIDPAGDDGFSLICSEGLVILINKDGTELNRTVLNSGYISNESVTEDLSPDENGKIIPQAEINISSVVFRTYDGGYASVNLIENEFMNAVLRLDKHDSNGVLQWTSEKRLDEYSTVVSLIQTSDGGYVVLGMYMKY